MVVVKALQVAILYAWAFHCGYSWSRALSRTYVLQCSTAWRVFQDMLPFNLGLMLVYACVLSQVEGSMTALVFIWLVPNVLLVVVSGGSNEQWTIDDLDADGFNVILEKALGQSGLVVERTLTGLRLPENVTIKASSEVALGKCTSALYWQPSGSGKKYHEFRRQLEANLREATRAPRRRAAALYGVACVALLLFATWVLAFHHGPVRIF